MMYLFLALVKVFDNIIMTAKSLATYRGQKLLSSVLVAVSQLLFYLVIDQVVNDSTITAIIIVSISSGIGNYLAFMINDRFKKDDKWWIFITMSDTEFMNDLCDYLAINNIKCGALNGMNRRKENAVHLIIFSKSKKESEIVKTYLNNSKKKYLIEIMK